MNANVFDGYQITILELHAPDGTTLPAIDVTFWTRSDPNRPDRSALPVIRFRPRDVPELVQALQEAYRRAESQGYGGPNQLQ